MPGILTRLEWKASRLLHEVDRALVRDDRTGYRVYRYEVPDGLAAVGSWPPRFRIPLERVTTTVGFSFARDGWHPHVETLREYDEDPSLDYSRSSLARLYRLFQPSTLQEVLIEDSAVPLPPFSTWPPVQEVSKFPWHRSGKVLERLRRTGHLPATGGHMNVGPAPAGFGERQFQRTIALYRSIKDQGFLTGPDQPPIAGYFLVNGPDFRFVVRQGNHRLAALAALGHEWIEVRFHRDPVPVVDRRRLDFWSSDTGGPYPIATLEALFDKLFAETGREKARRWGLV